MLKSKSEFYTIGLMSGTSLDGIDLAYCKFTFANKVWSYEFLETKAINYSSDWRSKFRNAIHLSESSLSALDKELGEYFGKEINQFISDKSIVKLDFIASHGHTIFHQPERRYTLQIGCGKTINEVTKIKTIFDFRSLDVSLGGQGAPLVPIGDKLLFNQFDYCINIGGISNVSFDLNGVRKAFDICFSNMVLNPLANKLGKEYDDNGDIAKANKVNPLLLEELLQLDFNKLSLGIEIYQKNILPILDSSNETIENQIATFTEYMAIKIAESITQNSTVLITGGGTFNSYLIKLIKEKSKARIKLSNKELIDFKEALIFAFLGVLKVNNIPNCLASVTGAKYDCVGGKVAE